MNVAKITSRDAMDMRIPFDPGKKATKNRKKVRVKIGFEKCKFNV